MHCFDRRPKKSQLRSLFRKIEASPQPAYIAAASKYRDALTAEDIDKFEGGIYC